MKKTILILFGLSCLVIGIVFLLFNFVFMSKKYQNYVEFYCDEYNLDSSLVYAIIKAESNFDANAVSRAGALGLMQLLPSTAKWIAGELNLDYYENDLFEPSKNIRYGCFYLRYLMNKFDNIDVVVCAYNAGETIVKSWLDEDGRVVENKISYSETKSYLKKVKAYYQIYAR